MSRNWVSDVSPADWIGERLHPFGQDTGSVVPEGFDAYARLFHPAGEGGAERWADIARRNGRTVHPEMQLHLISRPVGVPPPRGNDFGVGFSARLPREIAAVLVGILRHHTTSPESCWFCVWEGYGGVEDHGVVARVQHSARSYLLVRGPIDDAVPAWDENGPNLWWPEDRAWIVVSEIDYAWTYIGGAIGLIDAVVSDPRLEALPARLSDRPFYDGDLLNAALDLDDR